MFKDLKARHPLFAFLLVHLSYGLAGGGLLGALILIFDFGKIRSMAMAEPMGWLYILLLFFGLLVTFGSVGMGIGIMGMGEERDGSDFPNEAENKDDQIRQARKPRQEKPTSSEEENL